MASSIQARNLIRFAKKNGLEIYQGSNNNCALATTALSVGLPTIASVRDILKHFPGRSEDDLDSIEIGFEGWENERSVYTRSGRPVSKVKQTRYVKVGKNLRRLAKATGLTPSWDW